MVTLRNMALGLGAALLSGTAFAQDALPDVLILGATGDWVDTFDVEQSLAEDGRLGTLTTYQIPDQRPEDIDFRDYDAVLVFASAPFDDPASLGDRLADYVDGGGGVVVAGYAFGEDSSGAPSAIGGRLVSDGYLPLTVNGTHSGPVGRMAGDYGTLQFGVHESVLNVVRFYGGLGSFHTMGLSPASNALITMAWEDGEPLAAVKDNGNGRVVALNMFPVSNRFAETYPPAVDNWDILTNGQALMASSILWTLGDIVPCLNTVLTQDLNCNGIDESFEGDIDTGDPECDQGQTQPNQDWYFNYDQYGCEYEVANLDMDGDGFGGQPQQVFPDEPSPNPFPDLRGPTCDNCPADFNPDQRNLECDGAGDLCDSCPTLADQGMDQDQDGIVDDCDNCGPPVANADQGDLDYDVVGDACDNCPELYNPNQEDGGVPDANAESETAPSPLQPTDGVGNDCDNCVNVWNADQYDGDADGVGDACDNCITVANEDQRDSDGDGLGDLCDPCPLDPVIDPGDRDQDGVGDRCDICGDDPDPLQLDGDLDGVGDACDNCPLDPNQAQADGDGDGVGNPCDICPTVPDSDQADEDDDGIGSACDNCPELFNVDQNDRDLDGVGDACDVCPDLPDEDQLDRDGDGIGDLCDNCPSLSNPDQLDDDQDGLGNTCDYQIRGGGATIQCSTGGAPLLGWLVVGLGLVGLRRRRSA